jgi:hypothetical protein
VKVNGRSGAAAEAADSDCYQANTSVLKSQAGWPKFISPPIGGFTITLQQYRLWEAELVTLFKGPQLRS